MQINILVISNYKDYHTTRPEAEIFKGLAKLGLNIYIMTDVGSKHVAEFKELGITVIDFLPKKKFDEAEIERIRNTIISNNIHIIHLFNPKAIYNGTRAAKGLPVKVVLYRGFSSNIHWHDPSANFKFQHPRVDKIFCNSAGVAEHLHRQLFFDKSKTIVINKGHQVSWYSDYKPIKIREELGISSDALLLVNVANNRKMKGIPYLLKAMNNLPEKANVHLLLVGRDMDDKKNMKIISQGNKNKNIHILGFRKDALNIVAACDVFVLSSISGESITKSVIEAMSLGVAPIISDIRGNVELVKDNESGLVFSSKKHKELSNAIMKFYNDRDFCKKVGENARLRIKNRFNSEQTIIETKKMYENLMEEIIEDLEK